MALCSGWSEAGGARQGRWDEKPAMPNLSVLLKPCLSRHLSACRIVQKEVSADGDSSTRGWIRSENTRNQQDRQRRSTVAREVEEEDIPGLGRSNLLL